MKNKLEVGMYCYNKTNRKLGIGKIIGFQSNNNINVRYKNDIGLVSIGNLEASYNLIDILKVGDVIIDKEGHKYPINYEFETDYNGEYKSYEITIDDHITLFLKDGLSIVTHEQMEQMSYRIGDEE